ncbi:hypothetical protein N510_002777 [Firmicutes bacterium ASF500]|nr:hypothetical protein N510_002777 [Firmicutes bacterium ASF500]
MSLLTLGGLTLGGSAAVVLLALAGRTTWGRYGSKWRCWAWLALCLRLAVPLPLMPQSERRAPIQMDLPPAAVAPPAPVVPGDAPGPAPAPGPKEPAASAPEASSRPDVQPPAPARRPSLSPAQIALGVWLLGAAAFLAWTGAAHLRFLRWLRRWAAPVTGGEAIAAFNQLGDRLGLDRRPRLLVCQGLKAPMLAGLLRPAILLPPGALSGEELGFSLLHELTHYRRRDVWLKTLVLWVNALHWFNPLMWYMVRLVERDIELACDEDALRALPPQDFAAYGQTILDAVARLRGKDGL